MKSASDPGERMHRREAIALLAALFSAIAAIGVALATAPAANASQPLSQLVGFDTDTPLASNLEMAHRLLTPLTAANIPKRLAKLGKGLRDQPIDLQTERFRVYVPQRAPAAGYGLLVFIPPWEDDHLPSGWDDVLEATGVIFVSGVRTGNSASVLGRREPLALLEAYNVMRHYEVDPERVYIAGFSGGSKVALRLAVAYPDLFRGAFLDAGSDPIGDPGSPFPPRALFDRFRTTSKLVYFAGGRDQVNSDGGASSIASLRRACVVNITERSDMGLSHAVAPASDLMTVLRELDKPARIPTAKESECWSQLTGRIDAALSRAAELIAEPDPPRAKDLLESIDRRFSGLAAPRIVELANSLSTKPQ